MDRRHFLEQKVFSYMEKLHMVEAGDRVVAGISGGADSVCLLFLLSEYQKKLPFRLAAVHVNHGIRPDAGEDAVFVRRLCEEQGIPFFLFEGNATERARAAQCSVEEAGRRMRYESFREAAVSFDANRIAVAHNANDCSETMLFHLFRGTGLKGLCGIPAVRGEIIRPLLLLERAQIEEYLALRGIPYQNDSTNEEDGYTRNRIRHHILPYAEAEIARGAVAHMSRTAMLLTETEDYLERQTTEALSWCAEETEKGFCIDAERFLALHGALQKRLLMRLASQTSSKAAAVAAGARGSTKEPARQPEPFGAKDLTADHVEMLLGLFEQEGNRTVCLPRGIRGRREYGRVILEVGGAFFSEASSELSAPPDGMIFTLIPVEPGTDCQEVPQKVYTKWFDYDKIKGEPVLRTRKTGDYLMIAGQDRPVHKSVKEYMIAVRIPAAKRDKIPVLAVGSHVLWIVGYRISEAVKVDRDTKNILQVQWRTDGGETWQSM